jgi:hypothetical protein
MVIFVKIKIEKNLDSIYSIFILSNTCNYRIKNNKVMFKRSRYKIDLTYKVKYKQDKTIEEI